MIIGLYEWELLALCQHPGNIGEDRHYDSADLIIPIYYLISHDHVFEDLRDFTGKGLHNKPPPCRFCWSFAQ